MKGSIILPLVQILLIIIISTLLCFGVFLYLFNNNYGPESSLSFSIFITHVPHLLLNVFPIVVLLSIVLSLVNTFKTPTNRGFAVILTLITASFVYYAGYTGLYMLDKISEPSPIIKVDHLYPGKINPLLGSKLFINNLDGKSPAIEIRENPSGPVFIPYGNAEYNPDTNKLVSKGSTALTIEPVNPFFTKLFSPSKILRSLLDDLSIFNRSIRNIFEKSRLLFMVTVISQIAFAVGCWTIIRLSRWPFLNSIVAIAVIRLFPAYYRLSYNELTQKTIGFLQTAYASDLAPVALLLIVAILLFLWDILFIKNRNWVDKNG